MANKIIHKHSSVITEDGKPKLPNQNQIEYGEIAINYAVGEETISLKNSSNQIVEFKTDQYYKNIIDENEFATANALTDLNYRLNETNELLDTKSPTGHTHVSSAITDSISVSSSITNSASGLVQGKAVYNYAAPKSHTHSNYSPTGHTHDIVTSSNNGFAPKVSDGGTIDNSSNDLVLTSDNGTVGWRKLPANAFKDTDTKVTTPDNHYTPTGDANSKLSVNASGASAAWSIDVVKGITVERDTKGHITNLLVTSGKIPGNPNTDTKVIQTPTTTNAEYPVLLAQSGQTGTITGTTYFDSGITINPSSNTINAKATSAITADKVSNNLTITLNNGSTEDTDKFTFDGSSGKTINITASNIGAATINDIDTEIAKVVANAPENFNTLKEIADWISNDTTGAAKMANDIDELKNSKSSTGHTHSAYSLTGHTHVSSAITDSISASGNITSDASGLVQGKAVYNYAAPKSHTHSAYSPTGHTHVSSAITDSISVSGSITSDASGLVQGKAVYNYAAPKSHASSATTYGAATTSNYGHVKISNGDVATVASADGLAAGMDHTHSNYSTTGHTHVSSAITDSINSMSGITGTETKLVQAKAVYELINDTEEQIAETLLEHDSRLTTLSNNFDSIVTDIEENELVTATAITELENIVNGISEELDNKSNLNHTHSNYSPTGHTHVSSAITDSISASSSITSTASGLVQGKAVYNYAAPKSHASSATTYGAATTSNYGHVKISNGDVATVASANGLAAGMDHTHSNYSPTGHTHSNYSTTGHTHSNYSPTGHTHVSSDITDIIKCKFSYNIGKSGGYTTIPITFVSGSTSFTKGDLIEISFTGVNTSLQTGGFTNSDKVFKIGFYNTNGNFETFDNTYLYYYAGCKAYFRVLFPVTNDPSVPLDATTVIIVPIFNTVNGGYSCYAINASEVNVSTNNTSSSFPLIFTNSVTAGNKSLYTDSVNSLHYNPSTNTLTVPTASITTAKASTIHVSTMRHPTSANTTDYAIQFNNPVKLYNYSNINGTFNVKGSDHESHGITIYGGSTTGVAALVVNGKNGETTTRGNITCGKLTYTGGSLGTSDERLKTFTGNIDVDFDKLKQIPKKYFTWNYDEEKVLNLGTSAQEVEKVYPEIVGEYIDESTDIVYKSIDYSKLSIVALAAIDKLNERIEYLENKLKEYENK